MNPHQPELPAQRPEFSVDEALRIADQNSDAYDKVASVSRTLAAEVRRLAASRPADGDWVMVPREPTEAMRAAFDGVPVELEDMLFQQRVSMGKEPGVTHVDQVLPAIHKREFHKRYAAMLASAPTSAKAGGEPTAWIGPRGDLIDNARFQARVDGLPDFGDLSNYVPLYTARKLIDDAYNAGVKGEGYAQQVSDLHDAAKPTPDAAARARDLIAELTFLYTSGYLRGHHDTVEGNFTDVAYIDRFDYLREDTEEVLNGSEFIATWKALTTPSDAGGDVVAKREWRTDPEIQRRLATIEDEGERMDALINWLNNQEDYCGVLSIAAATMRALYTTVRDTPPNPGDARLRDGLRALSERWREVAHEFRYNPAAMTFTAEQVENCADELLSLLDGKGVGS